MTSPSRASTRPSWTDRLAYALLHHPFRVFAVVPPVMAAGFTGVAWWQGFRTDALVLLGVSVALIGVVVALLACWVVAIPRDAPIRSVDQAGLATVRRALREVGRGRPVTLTPRLRDIALAAPARTDRILAMAGRLVVAGAVAGLAGTIIDLVDGETARGVRSMVWPALMLGAVGVLQLIRRRSAGAEHSIAHLVNPDTGGATADHADDRGERRSDTTGDPDAH